MKLKFGILGAANIAKKAIIPAILRSENVEVAAIASGSGKGEEFAKEFNIPKVYSSYEELLADPDIDAVYIPLPNHLHKEWVIRSAEAKKHVLCEKPAALTSGDAEEMAAACEEHGVKFMEAFMYQFHPQHARVKEIIKSGEIGDVRLIRSSFSFYLEPEADNIRLKREAGGGALYDVGCYCVHASRMIMGEEPASVQAAAYFHPELGVDLNTAGILEFSGGKLASFDCSFERSSEDTYEVLGTRGTISVPFAFRPDKEEDGGLVIVRTDGNERKETIPGDQYRLQIEHFADSILSNGPLSYDGRETVKNMKVIEALYDTMK